MRMNDVKYPCRSCVYRNECGDSMRTEHCAGRATKSELKAQAKRVAQEWIRLNEKEK